MPQDSLSWHPIITTLHPSCKTCAGFPVQNASSINLHVCRTHQVQICIRCLHAVLWTPISCYKWFWSLPTTSLDCCVSLYILSPTRFDSHILTVRQKQMQDAWLSLFFLLWTLHLEHPSSWSQTLFSPFVFQNKTKSLPLLIIMIIW